MKLDPPNSWGVLARQAQQRAQAPTTAPLPPRRRRYEAARVDRLTAGFPTSSSSIDFDLRRDLVPLRSRSRHLAKNNEYAKAFLRMVRANVVGPVGFKLQMQVKKGDGTADTKANADIERAFTAWAKRGVCEISGKLSLAATLQLLIRVTARDGEFLVRKVWGRTANRFGFALQVLAVDRLDVTRNEDLGNGNRICMGVEMDRQQRPVAYWIHREHPASWTAYDYSYGGVERVPASDVYHGFVPEDTEQTRGVPWMHAAILRLQNHGGFEEAAIIAARVGAAKMGFFTSPAGDASALGTGGDGAGGDGDGSDPQIYMDAEPGEFQTLPPGYELAEWKPEYPTAHYEPFIKACLRGAAAGLGVTYHGLANDLEGVNFSSARVGVLDEREEWKLIQGWFVDALLIPMFNDWLGMALLSGAITTVSGAALPVEKQDKFNAPQFVGRRWAWVDPMKDMQANVMAVEQGFRTRKDIIAEDGDDYVDVFEQLAIEKKEAERLGLKFGSSTKKPAVPSADGTGEDPAAPTNEGGTAANQE